MSIQVLIAIAQLCHYSVAPSTGSWGPSYDNKVLQLKCQKTYISCVRDEKNKKSEFDILADCVNSMEWK